LTDISKVLTASIITLMMEAASTSETLVNFYQTTRRNNPESKSSLCKYCFKVNSQKAVILNVMFSLVLKVVKFLKVMVMACLKVLP
jgi:ribosomal protein L33